MTTTASDHEKKMAELRGEFYCEPTKGTARYGQSDRAFEALAAYASTLFAELEAARAELQRAERVADAAVTRQAASLGHCPFCPATRNFDGARAGREEKAGG